MGARVTVRMTVRVINPNRNPNRNPNPNQVEQAAEFADAVHAAYPGKISRTTEPDLLT